MGKLYLISDTHFNHEKIIEYCNRPFKTVGEMNLYIIKRWNRIVMPEDTVIHLGDFCFGDGKAISDTCNLLNGHKILMRGNHDKKGINFYKTIGFDEVFRGREVTFGNFILSHRPIIDLSYDIINIHGHIHNIDTSTIEGYNIDNHINVSADVINFMPIRCKELEIILKIK